MGNRAGLRNRAADRPGAARRKGLLAGLALGAAVVGAVMPAAAEPLVIGASRTGLLIWAALDAGLFEAEGVEVEVVEVGSGVAAVRDVFARRLDFGTSSEFAFISEAMEHPGLCIYATLSASSTARLIGRRDRLDPGPAGLAGRRIAVTRTGIGEYFLWQYLALHGMSTSEVEIVDIPPREIVAAVVEGRVDAAMTWEPYVEQIMIALGEGAITYEDQGKQYYYFTLNGRCALDDERPDAVRAVMRALVAAEQLARDRPDEVKRRLGARFGLTDAMIATLWPQHALNLVLSNDLLALMEEEARWRIRSGLTSASAVPDVLYMVQPGPLRDVAPYAAQIVD